MFIIFYFISSLGTGQTMPARIIDGCPSSDVMHDTLRDVLVILKAKSDFNPLGLAKPYAAESCSELFRSVPWRKPGVYWIRTGNSVEQHFCQDN